MDVMNGKNTIGVGPATLAVGVTLAVPKNMQNLVWEVSNVYVPPENRGQGWGTKAMRQACDRADSANVGLLIHVHAECDKDQERLIDWYEGFGFVTIQSEPHLMFRPQRTYRNLH